MGRVIIFFLKIDASHSTLKQFQGLKAKTPRRCEPKSQRGGKSQGYKQSQ